MPVPGEQPDLTALPPESSPVKRRLAAQYVREARDRLTSSSGTRPAFDYELLRQYAQNRLSASLVMLLLVGTIGLLSSLWTGPMAAGTWTASVLVIHAVMVTKCRQFLEMPMHEVVARTWRLRFIMLDLFYGLAWMFILIHPVGADESSSTFMLFIMLLVVAVSSMLASSLPIAVFAATFPVTAAVSLDFALQGTLRDYILAIMAITAQGYFAVLGYRLYSTTLATLVARAEKDALIGELEQAKAISDEARQRAEAANISKSRFLAQMSHELRTPLNAILGFSEVMKTEVFGEHAVPAYKEYSADIHNSGVHLLGLINEILDLSRIEAGRYELNELVAAGLDTRQVENLVDQPEQMHTGIMDIGGIFLVGRHRVLAEHFRFHHFGEPEDGIERRAQFVAHLREEARLRDVGGLRALPRFVGNRLGLFQLADQRVFLRARLQRRQRGRIEPVGQHGEVALRGDRHDGEDVVAQGALQDEVERDRRGHREGGGEHRHRQARGQHAGHRHHQQHDEQHKGARAFVGADRMNQNEHPGQPVEQVEQDEAQPPGLRRCFGHRQLKELPAFADHDGMDDQHRGGPGAGDDGAGPQARQEADGRHQQQDHQRRRQPVLRILPQQLVIESRAGAARRRQPVARLAHVLRGKAALHRRGFRWQRGEIGLFAWNRHKIDSWTHKKLAPTSPKILKTKLKSALKTLVNVCYRPV